MDDVLKKYGLIGYPLSHSFSPRYFKRKFKREGIANARYDLYPIDAISKIENIEVHGLNVTIPYKEAVIDYLDDMSDVARNIGAVNTIDYRDGKMIGHNTDAYGFEHSLRPLTTESFNDRALILGSGGAAKAVQYVLQSMSIQYMVVSRSKGDVTYAELDKAIIENHHLIINTTPLGMSPNIDTCPDIPYEYLSREHILYDLVYNPEKTLFLNKGAQVPCTIKNGLEMLELQADEAWRIWNK